MKRWPLITTFILFITLCVSVAYWGIKIFQPPQRAVASPPQASRSEPELNAASGLFGGRTSFIVASNFQLKGVVVASDPTESVAILSNNGKPALAIRTGREVATGITVKDVHKTYVLLSERGLIKRVNLPEDTLGK